MTENYNLAPDIRTLTIGVRAPKENTIYPISVANEKELLSQFISAFSLIAQLEGTTDADFIDNIKDAVYDNIETILLYVTDEDAEVTTEDFTNAQFLALCEIVFEVNFEVLLKNGKSFIEKMKTLFNSMKQQPE